MSKQLPLKVSDRRATHSSVVPAWEDAFDLRTYFACIHPADYELKAPEDLAWAKQIYALVQAHSVHRVAIYRETMLALPERPIVQEVLLCIQSFYLRPQSEHLSWFTTSALEFCGKSPQAWFAGNGHNRLADLLRGCGRPQLEAALREVPLANHVTKERSSAVLCRTWYSPAQVLEKLGPEQRDLLSSVRMLLSEDEWEDEFDLSPYLALWIPTPELARNRERLGQLLELYAFMRREFMGWLRVYRGALEVACRQSGILEAVARCCLQVREGERDRYLGWFDTPQAEFFGGVSPRRWFRGQRLEALEWMLAMGRKEGDPDAKL